MPVPKGTTGENTRDRILAAALPLFAANGFAGTSTRLIAKAAKVNVATLAYYFEGKEGLYMTVLQHLYEDLLGFLPSEVPPVGPETVKWLSSTAWAFCQEHREHIRLVLRHVLDQGLHDEVVVGHYSEPVLMRLEMILGSFRPDWTPVRTRLYIFGTMHMLVRFAIEDRVQLSTMLGGPEDLDQAVVSFLEDFLQTQLYAKA
ncbi:MAG: AcrR family transcriptional regulator [Myxococcota bacterium]